MFSTNHTCLPLGCYLDLETQNLPFLLPAAFCSLSHWYEFAVCPGSVLTISFLPCLKNSVHPSTSEHGISAAQKGHPEIVPDPFSSLFSQSCF